MVSKKTTRVIQLAIAGWMVLGLGTAQAATLKQVQVTNGEQIDLLFDGKVAKNQIHTEFFNDIIQIILTDVSVYPAKISSVNSGKLLKVFAYQYAPKLVRCRLTVKGKAEDFKDKIQINSSSSGGKMLTIRLQGSDHNTDQLAFHAAQATHAAPVATAHVAKAPSGLNDSDEKALLERVIQGTSGNEKTAAPAAQKPAAAKEEEAPVAGTRPESSIPLNLSTDAPAKVGANKVSLNPMRMLGKLIAVLGLFGIVAVLAKKFLAKNASGRPITPKSGVFGAISRFAQQNLGAKGKVVDVLASHYLGPKKSIAVVKIAGRILVLGVTADSINLITQLSGDSLPDSAQGVDASGEIDWVSETLAMQSAPAPKPAARPAAPTPAAPRMQAPVVPRAAIGAYANASTGTGATTAGAPVFSDLLQSESAKPMTKPQANFNPATAASVASNQYASAQSSVRSQIRSRTEGMKPL